MRGSSRAGFENGTTGTSVADFAQNESIYPKIKLNLEPSSVGRKSKERTHRRRASRDQELGYTPERRGAVGFDRGIKHMFIKNEAPLEPNSRGTSVRNSSRRNDTSRGNSSSRRHQQQDYINNNLFNRNKYLGMKDKTTE